jgi:5-methyltetrahydropteroyltriglutamate--homocysteine methyltransferase
MPMSIQAIPVATLGVPRIGPRRELKAALESYWSSKSDATALREAAAGIRAANWSRQHALGITHIPSNDFSLYDHVLDTSIMVGAVPEIYGWRGGNVPSVCEVDAEAATEPRGRSLANGFRPHLPELYRTVPRE